jgi:hypothetical protein
MAVAGSRDVADDRVALTGSPVRVDRCVVRDAIQPRLQLAHLRSTRERQPGVQEDELQDILGTRVGQAQATAVPLQWPAVALHQRLERSLLALAHEPREALV